MENIYTAEDLTADYHRLGIPAGCIIELHSSLSSIGYVVGAAVTVIDSLLAHLGSQGTLIAPAHTSELSGPEVWNPPPTSAAQLKKIHDGMPVFDPQIFLPVSMG